jgi:CheY-like chemotaxis protein
MKTKRYGSLLEELNVLVVGNNPTELGRVFDSLNGVPGKRIITEIAFDLETIVDRLTRFKPNFILIDDNIGKSELNNSVQALLRYRKTKRIPITVLKNSNYQEAISSGVMNYILKEHLTGESLYKALKNSMKFRQTQRYLFISYKRRKGQLSRLLG